MSKIIKRFNRYLYNREIDIRERLFVLLAVIALSGMLMALIASFFIGENVESMAFVGIGLVFFSAMVWIGQKFDKIVPVSYVVAFVLIFIFLPANFLTSGGIHGGALAWNVFDTLYVAMILRGKPRVFFLLSEAVVVIVTYVAYLKFPEYVFPHTEETAWQDSIASFFIVSIIMIVMLAFQLHLYRTENKVINDQKDEINELNRAQNRFFSSMSHEIRTPINTIIGLNEMILRENASTEINEDAENIESASKILLHLINDILDMSKFQSGQMELNPTVYRTGDMITDVAGMIWVRAREKNLSFQVDVAPGLPAEMMGDEMRIKQILINILNNAIKYTKEGSVTMTVGCEEIDEHRVKVIYTVTDTGVGIRKESIPYLFDAFKRVDTENNFMIEGTGLGLTIVKQFVDLMGGRINVNSVYTKGSTFIIEIPQRRVGRGMVGEMRVSRWHSEGNRGTYRASFVAPGASVLVVDDTETNLMVVEKLLRDTQVRITCVPSGEAALEHTLDTQYDVIFMDHMMPEMDGIECLHRLRNQTGGFNKNTPVVALTANAGSEREALYAREGFDGYLVKPISGMMLEQELRRLLPAELVTVMDVEDDVEEKSKLWCDTHEVKAVIMISADSVIDLPEDVIDRYGIRLIPVMIETEEGMFRDSLDISTGGVIKYMEDEDRSIQTKKIDTERYVDFFAESLREARTVIHFSVSKGIALSSYYAAVEAAASFDDVIVINSDQLSSGMGMMVVEACKMAESGVSPTEIVERMDALRSRIVTSFIVDDMNYLERASQISRWANNLAKSFMVRPAMAVKRGRMRVGKIFIGPRESVWKRYIKWSLRHREGIDREILYVTYVGLDAKEREWILEQIDKRSDFEEIRLLEASPAVAVNSGPGTFGLSYRKK